MDWSIEWCEWFVWRFAGRQSEARDWSACLSSIQPLIPATLAENFGFLLHAVTVFRTVSLRLPDGVNSATFRDCFITLCVLFQLSVFVLALDKNSVCFGKLQVVLILCSCWCCLVDRTLPLLSYHLWLGLNGFYLQFDQTTRLHNEAVSISG